MTWCPLAPRKVASPPMSITGIDFSPAQGSSYNINYTNQGRTPTYSEVKQYRFNVNASGNATVSYYFDIHEDGFWSDPYLGTIEVSFVSGTPTVRYANSTGGIAPTGAPANGTVGTFWLACTGGKGAVRGNGSHGDDSHANVYVQIQSLHQSNLRSPTHSVRCQ